MNHETEIVPRETSPLASTLAKINGYSQYFKLHLGMPDDVGWRRAPDIINDDTWLPAQFARLHDKHPYYPKQVVVTNSYNRYQWYLVTAGMAGFLLDGRVPDLSVDNIAIKFDDEGWANGIALLSDVFACQQNDSAASLTGVTVIPDRERLRQHLAAQVWNHMRQLIPLMQRFTPVSEHVLRAATANGLAGTALWMLQAVGQHAMAEAESRAMAAALPFPTRLRYFEVECNGEREVYLDGGVCCHWYLRPDNETGEYCANCPRVPKRKRVEVLRGRMLARQRGVTEH